MKLPLVIGHRGVMSIAPENSLSGFRKAIELGIDGVELDVHMTKDKKLVVLHDSNIKRISGTDGNIGDFTYKELKKYDISIPFAKNQEMIYQKYPQEKIYFLEFRGTGKNIFYLNIFEQITKKKISFFLHWNDEYFDKVQKLIFPKISGSKIASAQLKIKKKNLFELQKGRLKTYIGERIPLLHEVLDMIKGKLFVNIEIKEGEKYYPGILDEIIKTTEHFGNDRILFSSFDLNTVVLLKKKYPHVKVNALCNKLFISKKYVNELDGLNPYYRLVRKYVIHMHTLKKTVYIWTVNNEIDMIRFILYGVDGIVSNYPQILKKANKAIGKILKDAHLYK